MATGFFSEVQGALLSLREPYRRAGGEGATALSDIWETNCRMLLKPLFSGEYAHASALLGDTIPKVFHEMEARPTVGQAVDWHLRLLESEGVDLRSLPPQIAESPQVQSGACDRYGRHLSADFFRNLHVYRRIEAQTHFSRTSKNVVELGGGWGALARLFRLYCPEHRYVIIDLPEMLAYSYMFLGLSCPDVRRVFVTHPGQLRELNEEKSCIVFVPTVFAEELLDGPPVDLFLNLASMGEMENAVICHWMDFIQNKLKPCYFFGQNRFLNTVTFGVHDRRLSQNECTAHYDASWDILHWEVEPPHLRNPYCAFAFHRYLEILAQRRRVSGQADEVEQERARRSLALIDEVANQDWAVVWHEFFDQPVPILGTCLHNPLANDLTMDGTLFKLWESIRLRPSVRNVWLMVMYLHTLLRSGDSEFEEVFYYEKLLKGLLEREECPDRGTIEAFLARKLNRRLLYLLELSTFGPLRPEHRP